MELAQFPDLQVCLMMRVMATLMVMPMSMKVKMEEVKATRLLLVVNTVGVFGRDSDEVLSASPTSHSSSFSCQ